jgi:hypothetical protein
MPQPFCLYFVFEIGSFLLTLPKLTSNLGLPASVSLVAGITAVSYHIQLRIRKLEDRTYANQSTKKNNEWK